MRIRRGLLFLPDSKTGRKTVVLNAPALTVLAELPRLGIYVIAGENAGTKDEAPSSGHGPLCVGVAAWKILVGGSARVALSVVDVASRVAADVAGDDPDRIEDRGAVRIAGKTSAMGSGHFHGAGHSRVNSPVAASAGA